MAQLDRQIKARYPGVVIGWIGDAAHAQTVSDHNPDDTPGVQAAQTDSDNLQEVRALDVMIGPAFSVDQAETLTDDLTVRRENEARLLYVIWDGQIWTDDRGWHRYDGSDPHTNHVHISGRAGDDANTAPWAIGGDMSFTIEELLSTRIASGGLGVPAPGWEIRDWLKKGEDARQAVERLGGQLAELRETIAALVDAQAGLTDRVEEVAQAVGAITPGPGGGALTPADQAQAYRAAAQHLDPQ